MTDALGMDPRTGNETETGMNLRTESKIEIEIEIGKETRGPAQ